MKEFYIAVYNVKVWTHPDNELIEIKKDSRVEILYFASGGHNSIEAVIINFEGKEYWLTIPCFKSSFNWL